jgi:hypothetical protein
MSGGLLSVEIQVGGSQREEWRLRSGKLQHL